MGWCAVCVPELVPERGSRRSRGVDLASQALPVLAALWGGGGGERVRGEGEEEEVISKTYS
jgi:hypothetical protein